MQNESPKNFHFHFRAAAYLREAEECKASEMQNESPKNFHFHFRAAAYLREAEECKASEMQNESSKNWLRNESCGETAICLPNWGAGL